jgi:hypothetical protein
VSGFITTINPVSESFRLYMQWNFYVLRPHTSLWCARFLWIPGSLVLYVYLFNCALINQLINLHIDSVDIWFTSVHYVTCVGACLIGVFTLKDKNMIPLVHRLVYYVKYSTVADHFIWVGAHADQLRKIPQTKTAMQVNRRNIIPVAVKSYHNHMFLCTNVKYFLK